MQQPEQQRRAENRRRTAAGAHQPLQCAAEKQFLHHSGHGAKRQKLHEQLCAAAGQQGGGVLCPGQAHQQPAAQVSRAGHAQKHRQAECRAPWRRHGDAQVVGLQAGAAQHPQQRDQDSANGNDDLQQAETDLAYADGFGQTGAGVHHPHQRADARIQQAAGQ